MGKHRTYTYEMKKLAVERYEMGDDPAKICHDLNILSTERLFNWVKQYEGGNETFEETRGKARKVKNITEMTDKEYIKHLERENDILKRKAEKVNPWMFTKK